MEAGYSDYWEMPCVVLETTEGVNPQEVLRFSRKIGAALPPWGGKHLVKFPGEEPRPYYPEAVIVKITEGRELTREERLRADDNAPCGSIGGELISGRTSRALARRN